MIVIVGCIMVIGCVLTGFTWAGGNPRALIQPAECVTIGGASIGALVIMSSKKTLVDLVQGILSCVKGSPYASKAAYEDLFKMMYDLLRLARREGLMSLEKHIADPHESDILSKYPKISGDHHIMEFLCGAFSMILEGTVKPEQLPAVLNADTKLMEQEHHAPLNVLSKTADALPGFGIVAAVLGIVVTMSAIDGPVEEIGEKVGAALVGTFLGILMSYGFFAPMATRMEALGESELAFFRTLATIIQGNELAPKVVIDQARRGVPSDCRMSRERLDELFAEVDAG